jgi:hypothetical protein
MEEHVLARNQVRPCQEVLCGSNHYGSVLGRAEVIDYAHEFNRLRSRLLQRLGWGVGGQGLGVGGWGLRSGRWALGFRSSSGFGVWGLGFGVWGLGFGVEGLGFGVWGSGWSPPQLCAWRVFGVGHASYGLDAAPHACLVALTSCRRWILRGCSGLRSERVHRA